MKNKEVKNRGIIFIPGVHGGAFKGRYQDLENSLKKNYYFLKYQSWQNIKDLSKLTLNKIFHDLDRLINLLKEKGCNDIIMIGKSLGGSISLLYQNPKISAKVLWAPAIGISEKSNYKEHMVKKFSDFKRVTDITIDKKFLDEINILILIIHGDKDDKIPLESSKKIIRNIEKGELFVIEGAGHSYKKSNVMEIVNKKTIEFIKKLYCL